MSTDAAILFAQVIPTLIIATYLGNIGYSRIPVVIRALMFYFFLYAVVAEGVILYRLAYGMPMTTFSTALAFTAAMFLLLLLVIILLGKLGSKEAPQKTRRDD